MLWLTIPAAVLIAFELWLRIHFGNAARGVYAGVPTLRPRLADPDPAAVTIETTTRDGVRLAGSWWRPDGPSHGAVVFACESGATRFTATHYAAPLIEVGFDVIAFSFRNSGESDATVGYEPHHWPTNLEVDDMDAAFRWTRQHVPAAASGFGLLGVSKGGTAAAIAAVDCPDVRAIGLVSAFDTHQVTRVFGLKWAGIAVLPRWIDWLLPKWHIAQTIRIGGYWEAWSRGVRYPSLERALRRLRGREVLLISGARDSYIPLELARRLQAAAALGDDRLWLVPKSKHNGARDTDPEGFDCRLLDFFGRHLAIRSAANASAELDRRCAPVEQS